MLKKFLSIFIILCLVFSLTVPCFAETTGYYNFNNTLASPPMLFTKYGDCDFSVVGNSSYTFVFHSIKSTAWQNSVSLYYYNLILNHRYFFYMDSDYTFYINFPQSIMSPAVTISPTTHYSTSICTRAQNNHFLLYPSSSQIILETPMSLKNFYVLDITDLPSEWSSLEVYNYLSQFIDFSGSYINDPTVLYNRGLLAIPQFYSSLFHSWDFFVEHGFQSWSFVTVAISAVVALLVFIFVVVFLIKRFTGGKT